MKKINCRQFIGKSAMAAGAAFTLSNLTTVLPNQLHAAFKEEPIGFQTFSVKDGLLDTLQY